MRADGKNGEGLPEPPRFNEAQRHELAKLYGRIGRRFGFDRLLVRLRQGGLRRAAHARVHGRRP